VVAASQAARPRIRAVAAAARMLCFVMARRLAGATSGGQTGFDQLTNYAPFNFVEIDARVSTD
jgi:hypothetical protein